MPKMRSLKSKSFRYDKQSIEPGAVFNVTKRGDVKVLSTAGIAEVVNDQASKAPASKAKARSAKPAAKSPASKTPARKKTAVSAAGTYDRRDMKAK